MKSAFIILLTILITPIQAQTIPNFDSNTTDNEKQSSLVLIYFQDKYEKIISYTQDCPSCFPPYEQWFFILGYQNEQWELLQWTITFKNRTKTKENIKRKKKKKLKLKNESVDSLLTFWAQNGFWNLDNDSLNINKKQINDSMTMEIIVGFGCTEKFEIVNGNQYKIWYSHAPDKFQDDIPIRQREQFILCRIEFAKMYYKTINRK